MFWLGLIIGIIVGAAGMFITFYLLAVHDEERAV